MFRNVRSASVSAAAHVTRRRAGRARNRIAAAVIARAAVAGASGPADEPGVTVEPDRVASERARVEASLHTATSVDVRERGLTAEGIGGLLGEVPGLYARSAGDGLSPAGVSLRGSPSAQVVVALDGVVLNDGANESVDLSLLPPALIERVDVYRGAAPVRLGVAGLGGTIELITRRTSSHPEAFVTIGGGSFGARRAGAFLSGRAGAVSVLAGINYRGTQGTFTFYDTNGTALNTHDDVTTARANNQADAIDVLGRACIDARGWKGCALVTVSDRERGVPGPGSAQYTGTRLSQSRVLARADARWPSHAGALDAWLATSLRNDHFSDYGGSVVPGSPQDSRTGGTVAEAGVHANVRDGIVALEPVVRGRWEQYGALGTDAPGGGDRLALLVGADALVALGPVSVLPAFGLDVMHDASPGTASDVTRVLASPRVNARWRIESHVELRAGASHMERAPTLAELFGVPGVFAPSAQLRSETSNTVDGGVVITARDRSWNFRGELTGYHRDAHDLITFVRNGPLTLKALNVASAEVRGLECAVRLDWRRRLGVTASYALTDARAHTGAASTENHPLPAIPLHDAYVRLDGRAGPVRAWADVSYATGIYYDTASLLAAPPRILLAAAASLEIPRTHGVGITIRGENLLDQREGTVTLGDIAGTVIHAPVADYAGYPIAGRSFFVAVTYTPSS